MKLGVTTISGAVAVVAAIVASTVAIEARYESRAQADQSHSLLAGERESGELETETKLIELELRQLRLLQETRPLNREEQFRFDYLIQRRTLIEARLLESLKT